jgi:L,D-transpeptidase YbiS
MEDQELEKIEKQIDNVEDNINEIQPGKTKRPFSKTVVGKLIYGLTSTLILLFVVLVLPVLLQRIIVPISLINPSALFSNDTLAMAEDKAILEGIISKLDQQIEAYIPSSFYMIINSTDNEFSLMKGKEEIRHGKCSTGSYVVLEDHKQRKFLFKTPKGLRKVIGKKTDPVWTKPNWAFIEEGLPIPSATHPSRYEEGVLGDYALTLGDGYMIHGTIWQRYLGLPVTHGCVRLNDADLEVVFKSLQKGSHIYIY